MSRIGPLLTALTLGLAGWNGCAQKPVAVESGARRELIRWPSPPLPDGPIILDTAVQHQICLIVTKGFSQPWSMVFLPDGAILVTERSGSLRIVRGGVHDPKRVAGLPEIQARGLGGLMDLALHPRFNENKLVYFTYHKPSGNSFGTITLARGRWNGMALDDVRDLLSTIENLNAASRIVFGKDNMIYMSVGGGDPPGAESMERFQTSS